MPNKFIISGGGTGGHIFPAVAIANELRKRDPSCEILFIGAIGRMEMEKIPQEGYQIQGLEVAGLIRSLSLRNFQVIYKFIKSYFKAKKIVREFKPDCVIGTGGYASLAIGYAAGNIRIPLVIWEGNGYAGLTNKILAKKATAICTGLPGMEKFFPADKVHYTGNPVRDSIIHLPTKSEAVAFFKLDPDKPVVFITGGSLGAKTINQSIEGNIDTFKHENIQLIWQTGGKYQFNGAEIPGIYISQFIKEMNLAYAASDLVVSRAGALSIAEISVAQKPSVLIPSPNVTDDHQTKNALVLKEQNAAILIPDHEAKTKLTHTVITLLNDKNTLDNMRNSIGKLSKPQATSEIVNIIVNSIKK